MTDIDQNLQETLNRGLALDEIANSKGFEYIKAYCTNQIQAFSNVSILEGFTSLEKFNLERGKVLALRDLLGEIEYSIELLRKQRNEPTTTTPTE